MPRNAPTAGRTTSNWHIKSGASAFQQSASSYQIYSIQQNTVSAYAARDQHYLKNAYPTPTATTMPTASANRAQGKAWRVCFTPTLPKYTAST